MPFRYQQYESPYTGTIADIIGRQGQIRANAALESGQARARAAEIAGLGRAQMIGGIAQGAQQAIGNLGQIMQQKREAPIRAAEQALAMRERFAKIQEIEEKLATSRADRSEAELAKTAVQAAMRDAGGDHQKAADWLLSQGWTEMAKKVHGLAPPKPELHNVPAGGVVIDPRNPQAGPMFTAPTRPTEPAAVGSFEDFVQRKYGSNPTPDQITAARKEYQQADDRPINIRTGATGLTPNMESQVIGRLARQWTDTTKPARELDRQVSIMEAGLTAARKGDLAQGGQTILVTFQKILDPTSVVRESEFDRSREGQSLMQRARGAFERLTQGGPGVPLPELEKYAALAKEIATAQRNSRMAAIRERLGKTADRYKIPRELVFEADAPLPVSAPSLKIGNYDVTVEP